MFDGCPVTASCAGFDPDRIVEVHGTIAAMQCLDHCGVAIFPSDAYEVAIDESTMRAVLPLPAVQREEHGFVSLVIDEASVAHLSSLELHHRDPFDRILICQAIEHDLHVVTVDPVQAFEITPTINDILQVHLAMPPVVHVIKLGAIARATTVTAFKISCASTLVLPLIPRRRGRTPSS